MTRDEILQAIKQSHADLLAVVEGIPDDVVTTRPVIDWWTLKDLLGHVAMWEEVAITCINGYKQDGIPKMPDIKDNDTLDAYNKREVTLRRDLPLARVREELDAACRDLLAAVESLSVADLTKPLPPPWQDATLERFIADNSYGHIPEHLEQIKEWKARQKG